MKKRAFLIAALFLLAMLISVPSALATGSTTHRIGHKVTTHRVVTRAVAILKETDKSGVNGIATLRFNRATGNTTVRIRVSGLSPRTSHAAHIHKNSCDGPIVFTLHNVIANSRGIGRSRTVIKSKINTRNWFVNVHRDPALPSPGITCGKVKATRVIIIRSTTRR